MCMLLSTLTFAQQRELTGTVKDNKGEPLPGVSILIKSNGTGTATDMDGKYALNVSTGDVLVFSFIGYKPQTIAIADQKVLNIVLEDDVEQLQEVVVIGYGSVKKNDATGSVTAIKPDELSKGITTSAQDMLTGKIAGVSVISNDGAPGAGAQIRIRGGSSMKASNDPLIVVDGVPLEGLSAKEVAQKVAYLPQSRSVPNITAGRMVLHGRFPYLSYPRRYRREDHEMVKRALDWVGAADLASRPLPELSGGQRQKVYLAMALAQDTAAILMDEPTTYLDVGCQLEVMALARRLAEEGRAVVMVLHDLTLALRCAHRAALLHEGRVRQLGTPEELYRGEALEQVMGVTLGRVETAEGWRYFYR